MIRTATFVLFFVPTVAFAAAWKATTNTDRMTDSKVTVHEAVSDNTFNFAFPYRGATRARLLARYKSDEQPDVIFAIERGQLMNDVRDGEMRVRFDDGEVETFSTSRAASHDPQIAFLNNAEHFIEKLNKAKRVRVEFTVFSNGTYVADFRFAKPLPLAPIGVRQGKNTPEIAAPIAGRAARLALREDECRGKRELVECLVMVRACYDTVQADADEGDCNDQVARFPR